LRDAEKKHPIEEVGLGCAGMMSWTHKEAKKANTRTKKPSLKVVKRVGFQTFFFSGIFRLQIGNQVSVVGCSFWKSQIWQSEIGGDFPAFATQEAMAPSVA